MYSKKEKRSDVLVAIGVYLLEMAALYGTKFTVQHGITQIIGFITIVYVLSIVFVLIKDKSSVNLGFSKEKIKINSIIAAGIIILAFVFGICFSKITITQLLKTGLRILIMTALREELLFRGIVQNYLMALPGKKWISFVIGGVFFATIHIPLYSLNSPGLPLWLQLVFAFISHFNFCLITYWRKDITIPVALHFLIDFLGDVIG